MTQGGGCFIFLSLRYLNCKGEYEKLPCRVFVEVELNEIIKQGAFHSEAGMQHMLCKWWQWSLLKPEGLPLSVGDSL